MFRVVVISFLMVITYSAAANKGNGIIGTSVCKTHHLSRVCTVCLNYGKLRVQ